MQLSATEDIDASQDAIWARLSDMDVWEAQASRQLGTPLRRDPPGPAAPGTVWEGTANLRGRATPIRMGLREVTAPRRLLLAGTAGGLDLEIDALLEPLASGRTRLTVVAGAGGRSIAARLALQAAKLAQGRLESGLRRQLSLFAASLDRRADRDAAGARAGGGT